MNKKIISVFFTFMIICLLTIFLYGCSNSHNYSQKLISAISEDDYDEFVELLEQNKNLDSEPYLISLDRVNIPPLHYACQMGKFEYIIKLCEAGADVNNINHSLKTTPLMHAAKSSSENRFEILKYLIINGANVNIVANNSTALDYVFWGSDEQIQYDCAILLIENGASLTTGNLGHIIFNASQVNNKMMVKYLIENMNVNINLQDETYKNSSLMWAVRNDCYDVTKYLIESGADLSLVNKNGENAKDIAVNKNSNKVLNLLN